jgi:hypothetical protein
MTRNGDQWGVSLRLRYRRGCRRPGSADLPHATVDGWPRWVLGDGSSAGADRAGERWATQLEATGIPVTRMTAAKQLLSTEEHADKLEAVLAYNSQVAPLQDAFGSLKDPQLLGLEVDWRLPLNA